MCFLFCLNFILDLSSDFCEIIFKFCLCIFFRLYEDNTKKGKLIVQGLEEVRVHDKQDVYRILAQGSEKRKTGLFTLKKLYLI